MSAAGPDGKVARAGAHGYDSSSSSSASGMSRPTAGNATGRWYAGIGSMMNTTALKLRGITPLASLACRIPAYKREFSPFGFATLVPVTREHAYDDASHAGVHTDAVAHLLRDQDLLALEQREPESTLLTAVIDTTLASPWQGKAVAVAVSISSTPPEAASAGLAVLGQLGAGSAVPGTGSGICASSPLRSGGIPSARYHALMVEGAREAGMAANALALIEGFAHLPPPPHRYTRRDGASISCCCSVFTPSSPLLPPLRWPPIYPHQQSMR